MTAIDSSSRTIAHGSGSVSSWVERWSHLVTPQGSVLDIACGQGRHMQWFALRGHPVFGVDRSPDAIRAASCFGEAVLADIENGPWPLLSGDQVRQFKAVIVTHYLWRPLFPVIAQSVAPGGLLLYETFSSGNETVGKPSRPDFLLRPAELLETFSSMRIVAFEDGFLQNPPRFVQRIAAIQPEPPCANLQTPGRYAL
jgi:SAM-dependent methyltransferase